jgi:predicted RNA-binding Zn-ribbon protein involved in translation (DUF1610 family)
MSKTLRWSEKWFHRGLWLVALVFASFLIGLGERLVSDLPRVEHPLSPNDFIDQGKAAPLKKVIAQEQETRNQAQDAKEQAELQHEAARSATETARSSFSEWVATRRATALPSQDAALIERTRALEALAAEENQALVAVQTQDRILLDSQQRINSAQRQLRELDNDADARWSQAARALELRVFLYRLALTLPLLALAGWLFVRQRKSKYWPFVWGFIYFAGFTFFFELVPYLPSYGGYVHSIVGIALTILIGRYAIQALNRYRQKQQQAEQLPVLQRQLTLDYDKAQSRLAKSVCPGCERAIDLKAPDTDFCPHCGIGLFSQCPSCSKRNSSFVHYCPSCGDRRNNKPEQTAAANS